MQCSNIDREWTLRRGLADSLGVIKGDKGIVVDLPYDGMIGTPVSQEAPGQADTGYFSGDLSNYTKMVWIPQEWQDEVVGLSLDGAMMNATVEVNGCRVAIQHYGYAPFYVDLTNTVTFGDWNRITIHVNTSMHTNSRWYTGSGLFRGVELYHGPKLHIVKDGIFVYTKEADEEYAYLKAEVRVENSSMKNLLAEVTLQLYPETDNAGCAEACAVGRGAVQVNPGKTEVAYLTVTVKNPKLWDAQQPNLYRMIATVKNKGEFRTHLLEEAEPTVDTAESLFGIRTITVDSTRGLRINGKTVKLKGGCLHHDNGVLGAASLYETEARKVKKLKEIGFNAIRTTHNPPSSALIEACDRLGMYVFDEAFDAWGIAKRGGDYHQYFDTDWEKDLTAFVQRDRIHPSVILWSIGNEIPERGGLNNGYTLATRLAETVHRLDPSRPVSNGVCSYWSGLDDYLAEGKNQAQNSNEDAQSLLWEYGTEPFVNGLDVVGFNYLEDFYERNHEMFPDRVILGSENFPKEIGFRWPMVEQLPYVLGDFTWTAWDYIGEAGIGKAIYVDPEGPEAERSPWSLMPQNSSPYPWRTANDADYDINGRMLPQGAYRSVVWGSTQTHLYSMHPATYGRKEILSPWGFPYLKKNWNYAEYENAPVELVVFSSADEVELLVNGKSLGKKPVSKERPLPNSVRFETTYTEGTVEAVSYRNGLEQSRDVLTTVGAPASVRLVPEKDSLRADGHDVLYVAVEIVDAEGRVVPDAQIPLKAAAYSNETELAAYLAGFGSGNPITEENYTSGSASAYCGCAMAVIRSGYETGTVTLSVKAERLPEATLVIEVK